MPLFAFGLNHQTAPLDVRERVVFHAEQVTQALRDLVDRRPVSEAAIISTCNRTEVYCTTAEPRAAIDWLARDTAQRHGLQVSLHLAEPSPALDERTALAMYRMVQQMLVHMVRSAHATGFAVNLQQKSGDLVLTVQGEAPLKGYTRAQQTHADSDGARALRDEAHRLGGQLELADLPGRGSRITVRLPLAILTRAGNTTPSGDPL